MVCAKYLKKPLLSIIMKSANYPHIQQDKKVSFWMNMPAFLHDLENKKMNISFIFCKDAKETILAICHHFEIYTHFFPTFYYFILRRVLVRTSQHWTQNKNDAAFPSTGWGDHFSSWPLFILTTFHLDHFPSWPLFILTTFHLDHFYLDHFSSLYILDTFDFWNF